MLLCYVFLAFAVLNKIWDCRVTFAQNPPKKKKKTTKKGSSSTPPTEPSGPGASSQSHVPQPSRKRALVDEEEVVPPFVETNASFDEAFVPS